MTRRIAVAFVILVVIVALVLSRGRTWHRLRPPAQTAKVTVQPVSTGASASETPKPAPDSPSSPKESSHSTSEAAEATPSAAPTQGASVWKRYNSSEYRFEISYPPDWEFDSSYENNYGKAPSAGRTPAYAGETRNLFRLEMDGPDQSHEGGGGFDDGAIIDIRITGTSGMVEDWNMAPDHTWYPKGSTVSDWVKLQTSVFGGDDVKNVVIDTNGFKGAIQIACNGTNPCQIFGEEAAAYRTLPSGRALLVGWERMAGRNDFTYQKYLLPVLSSFRALN